MWLKSGELLLFPTARMAASLIQDQRLGRWQLQMLQRSVFNILTIKHRHMIKTVHIGTPKPQKVKETATKKNGEQRVKTKKQNMLWFFPRDFPSQYSKALALPWQDVAPQHDRAWQQSYAASRGCWRSGTKAVGWRDFTLEDFWILRISGKRLGNLKKILDTNYKDGLEDPLGCFLSLTTGTTGGQDSSNDWRGLKGIWTWISYGCHQKMARSWPRAAAGAVQALDLGEQQKVVGFHQRGYPKNGWFIEENHGKSHLNGWWLGVALFQETPNSGVDQHT